MTELLFLTDAYVKEFEAVVTAQVDGGVVLDRTAFYPGGGGQPCDFGVLQAGDETWNVKKVKKVSGQVVHFVDGKLPAVETAVSASHTQTDILYARIDGLDINGRFVLMELELIEPALYMRPTDAEDFAAAIAGRLNGQPSGFHQASAL